MMNCLPRPGLLTGQKKTPLVCDALKPLSERETAKRLACLGGSEPDLETAPERRRPPIT
jgi:hypothetical protein